jgi:hypothetical protein
VRAGLDGPGVGDLVGERLVRLTRVGLGSGVAGVVGGAAVPGTDRPPDMRGVSLLRRGLGRFGGMMLDSLGQVACGSWVVPFWSRASYVLQPERVGSSNRPRTGENSRMRRKLDRTKENIRSMQSPGDSRINDSDFFFAH